MKPMLNDLMKLIKDKRPDLAEALLPGLSIKDFEGFNTDIPADLRVLWAWCNGQSQSFYGNFHSKTNEMLMPLEVSLEVREELNELQESGDIPPDNWNYDWFPFTENGGGNYMCLSQKTSEIFYYDKYGASTGQKFGSFDSWLKDLYDGYEAL
ncbi:SMI1/KNR4 family protein [Zooshikella marina]|uniref:SMI1/KNR4 family protein n=1 Tax=Zooshikella ganghwensis TaxID=202772 RepID=UPI001BB09135|nr:SMI1/KNR4 family protein [Zooshikella ganghwensis]MBU2709042.1 SMI1/KNR4 family protein [Zooshikella ganghwensis]